MLGIAKLTNNKREAILTSLRKRIVAGEWKPGAQLPIRAALEDEFEVSGVTMQKALDQLKRDGFTYGKRRWGTFVVEHPPHLSQYGIVFPGRPGSWAVWVRFYSALVNAAASLEQSPSRKFPLFYGVEGHEDNEDYQRLLQDIRHQRLAGLIFPSAPYNLSDTPILLEPGLPMVSMVSIADPDERFPQVNPLGLDWKSFYEKALGYFASRGRRRIAVLTAPGQQKDFAKYLEDGLATRTMETRPYWLQESSQTRMEGAKACVHLLLHGRPEERPDGLIITDDNLVEYGVAGAVDADVQVGKEVDVVAHCNFPLSSPPGMPIKRLGFDARQLLQQSVEIINRRRRGLKSAPAWVPAVFEDELSQD